MGKRYQQLSPGERVRTETLAEDEHTGRFIAGCWSGRDRRSRGNRDGAGREQIIGWEALDGGQEVGSTGIYADMR